MSAARAIYRTTRSAETSNAITATFDGLGKRVFLKSEFSRLIEENREKWALVEDVSADEVIQDLMESMPIKRFVLTSKNYPHKFERLSWREPDPLEVAASIRAPKSYLCHASALFIHGLLNGHVLPLCVNYEQSDKPKPQGLLTQGPLDRAFQRKQRQSAFTFNYREYEIVVLSGKHTNGLEVQERALGTGTKVRVTSLERTLIDVVVRPSYAGGVASVLEAFTHARHDIDLRKLVQTLVRLDHMYPYHQAIGFYMSRAGFRTEQLTELKTLGLSLDFYLAHHMERTRFDPEWRIHYPTHLL